MTGFTFSPITESLKEFLTRSVETNNKEKFNADHLPYQAGGFFVSGREVIHPMAYTPELSMKSSCTLRRISRALGVPMTEGIDLVLEYLPKILDRDKVCQGCRDRSKCADCAFSSNNQIRKEVNE